MKKLISLGVSALLLKRSKILAPQMEYLAHLIETKQMSAKTVNDQLRKAASFTRR